MTQAALADLLRDDILLSDAPTSSELLLYQLWQLGDKRIFLRGTLAHAVTTNSDTLSEIEAQEKQLRLLKANLQENQQQLRELDEALVSGRYDYDNDSL